VAPGAARCGAPGRLLAAQAADRHLSLPVRQTVALTGPASTLAGWEIRR
jgi:hypothetical protein